MRILLVDDELEFVSTLAERLAMRGIDVEWANRPEDAVAKAKEKCFDIAVLDMKMPGLSGIGLKKILEHQCPATKYIFLTGHGSEEDFQAATSEGSSDYYLLKPVSIDQLLDRIQAASVDLWKED